MLPLPPLPAHAARHGSLNGPALGRPSSCRASAGMAGLRRPLSRRSPWTEVWVGGLGVYLRGAHRRVRVRRVRTGRGLAERPSLRKECAYAFVCKGEERAPYTCATSSAPGMNAERSAKCRRECRMCGGSRTCHGCAMRLRVCGLKPTHGRGPMARWQRSASELPRLRKFCARRMISWRWCYRGRGGRGRCEHHYRNWLRGRF